SAISTHNFKISKSTGKKIVLKDQPAPNYSSNGALTLVDGVSGNPKILGQTWLGFREKNLEAVIDFGEELSFQFVGFNSLDNKGSWIHLAGGAEIFISDDGENFIKIQTISSTEVAESKGKVEADTGKK